MNIISRSTSNRSRHHHELHQSRIQCRLLPTEDLEHQTELSVMLDEDLVDRGHNYPGGDMPSATCITCNFSDSEKTATDQITGGDDNLSNHPGASDAIAAAEQPISGGSNAEERLVPAAENALKSTHGLVA
ncbi:hypothetical protein DY000_02040312 [Brassica cretica]|uniref:Uncharacterized protein n=1 Tax=Brassica cretica TaxID=69181 RepID=A0ABQ7BEX8_BRACR|nr:hypothetical protein DY000_02040312 [Brassica cretica]